MGTLIMRAAVFVVLTALSGVASSAEKNSRITKCQMADGKLYFGPAPPPGCQKIAEYENGRLVTDEAAEAPATPTPRSSAGEE
jgi:hypothetical protein